MFDKFTVLFRKAKDLCISTKKMLQTLDYFLCILTNHGTDASTYLKHYLIFRGKKMLRFVFWFFKEKFRNKCFLIGCCRSADDMQMYHPECVPVTHDTIQGAVDWLWELDRLASVSKTATAEAVLKAMTDQHVSWMISHLSEKTLEYHTN